MPEGASEQPRRPKLSLSADKGRGRSPFPSDDGQTAILLPGPQPDTASPEAAEPEVRPSAAPAALGTSTLIGTSDAAAHESLAPGDGDLVRAKLRPSGGPLKRKAWFRDTADKSLFLAFAVAGFAGIFTAKFLSYSGLWVAFAAVGLLVAYALVSWTLDAFRSNPDRLGDNCYYMGFLFTLASLSAALVALQQDTASGRGDLLEALISGFGVALFSTIGGITLRVFFMQMRREIEDLEEQLRTELQRSARLLTDQLARAVIDIENFRIRTDSLLSQQVDGAASGFSRMAEQLVTHVSNAGSAYGAASQQMAANADRVAADIGRLADRVERIEVPSDLLTRQVDDARARIEALATALETAVEAGGSRQAMIETSAKSLDLLLVRMSDVSRFAAVESSTGAFAAAVDAAGVRVAGIGDRLSEYASSIGGIAAQVQRDGEAVARARELIDRDLRQSTEALHKLQGTLADVADGLVARVTAPVPPVAVGPAAGAS
jgi:phage-related protein